MTFLPARATIAESCDWLKAKTGEPWTLSRLLESGLTPWFWLDHSPGFPHIFGDKVEGFLAPLCFGGDTDRLAAGAPDVVVTMTRTHDDHLVKSGPPAWRIPINALRFKRDDITRLSSDITDSRTRGTLAHKPDSGTLDCAESSGKLYASMDASDLAEVVHNGEPIEWRYWLAQSRITPAQAAKLTYCIDPIRWPSNNYAQGPIDNELRIKIAKLENALMGNADSYTLGEITAFLGDPFAPYNMEMAASVQWELIHVSPAAAPVSYPDVAASPSDDAESGLLKSERQIRAIEAEAKKAGYDVLNIKTGCKAELRKKCKALRPELFGAGDDPFNDAWKLALRCNPPRLRMADHHKFAGR